MQTLADVGQMLRDARTSKSWSVRELARRAGVHGNTVYAAEKGRTSLELSTLLAIAHVLDIDLAFVPRGAPTAFSGLEGPGKLTPLQKRIQELAESGKR